MTELLLWLILFFSGISALLVGALGFFVETWHRQAEKERLEWAVCVIEEIKWIQREIKGENVDEK